MQQLPTEAAYVQAFTHGMEPDEVVELGRAFQALESSPAWRRLAEWAQTLETQLMSQAINGTKLPTSEQAAHMFGQVLGLRSLAMTPRAVVALAERAEAELEKVVNRE